MKSIRLLQLRNVLQPTLKQSSPAFLSAKSTGKLSPIAFFTADDVDVDLLRTVSFNPVVMNNFLQPRVVIFDGICPLCHSGVKWVINADKHRKIKFCCLQSETAEPYMNLCGVDREDVLRRFIFVEGLGQYHQASTAALKVASYLPLIQL